jgi:hypothetical protein
MSSAPPLDLGPERQDERWQSETFTNLKLASEFRTAVEGGHGCGRLLSAAGGAGQGGKLKPYTLHRDRRSSVLMTATVWGTRVVLNPLPRRHQLDF